MRSKGGEVDPAKTGERHQHDAGHRAAEHGERNPNPHGLDEQWHHERAACHCADDRALHRAEDATHYSVGNRPLEDRVGVDVDDGVAEADQQHRRRGHSDGRPCRDREQRRRPEQYAYSEVEREAAALGKNESDEAADEASDSHHRVEVADSRATEVEQVERERDHEDERCSGNDRLGAVHADDEP